MNGLTRTGKRANAGRGVGGVQGLLVDLVKRNPQDAEALVELFQLLSLQDAYIEFVALNHAQGRIPTMTWEQFAEKTIGADNYAKIRKI